MKPRLVEAPRKEIGLSSATSSFTEKSFSFHLLVTRVSLGGGHFARRYEECDEEAGGSWFPL